ncbi:hypothetical protein A1Q2_00936 [Trichosporon asahii var. asahii CBS 8904]|uniref:Uncharacterized protein n=1 Tax=Trichosporon asahii var. asahii (strain CBS 8904) TaxID=1220162 RepID=K1VVX0_TRIAC|nr:hypothetical protein A1Q2_00936 [Trichosporon asahii var. asahii CBS 8904]
MTTQQLQQRDLLVLVWVHGLSGAHCAHSRGSPSGTERGVARLPGVPDKRRAVSRIVQSTREKDPLWPNVVATIAYDTPHQLSQAASYAETARSVAGNLAMLSPLALGWGFGKAKQAEDRAAEAESAKERSPAADPNAPATPAEKAGGWWSAKTAMGIGALAMGAAAAAGAYYREDLQNTFFTCLPPKPPLHPDERTFTILPPTSDPLRAFWRPQYNSKAKDEIGAHMGMFNPSSNDGFYDLGLQVSRLIARRLLDPEAADVPRTPPLEKSPAPEPAGPAKRARKTKAKANGAPDEKDIIDLTGKD